MKLSHLFTWFRSSCFSQKLLQTPFPVFTPSRLQLHVSTRDVTSCGLMMPLKEESEDHLSYYSHPEEVFTRFSANPIIVEMFQSGLRAVDRIHAGVVNNWCSYQTVPFSGVPAPQVLTQRQQAALSCLQTSKDQSTSDWNSVKPLLLPHDHSSE